YITDSLYNFHSIDLFLIKDAQVKYFDTIKIAYTYLPVQNDVWMPFSKRYDINFNILKIQAEGYYLAIYKDYDLNPQFAKKYFSNETLSVDETSNKKDDEFWGTERPVPLTTDEVSDYVRKDSLEELRKSKTHLDSLDKKANKLDFLDVLLGYTYRKSYSKFYIRTDPFYRIINYNTVEGYNIRFTIQSEKEFSRKRILRITPGVRYGFSNTRLNLWMNGSYYYNRKKFAYINFDFGQNVFQFNRAEPINELVNSLYSLIARKII